MALDGTVCMMPASFPCVLVTGLSSLGGTLKRNRATSRIQLLNREEDFQYTFEFKGLNRMVCDLFEDNHGGPIGDLFIYELTAADPEHL